MATTHENRPKAPMADKQRRQPSVPPRAPRAPPSAPAPGPAETAPAGTGVTPYGRTPTGLEKRHEIVDRLSNIDIYLVPYGRGGGSGRDPGTAYDILAYEDLK